MRRSLSDRSTTPSGMSWFSSSTQPSASCLVVELMPTTTTIRLLRASMSSTPTSTTRSMSMINFIKYFELPLIFSFLLKHFVNKCHIEDHLASLVALDMFYIDVHNNMTCYAQPDYNIHQSDMYSLDKPYLLVP